MRRKSNPAEKEAELLQIRQAKWRSQYHCIKVLNGIATVGSEVYFSPRKKGKVVSISLTESGQGQTVTFETSKGLMTRGAESLEIITKENQK